MKTKKPRKAKDGLYHVQKYIGLYPDGRRCYERFSGKDWDTILLDIANRRMEFAKGVQSEPKLSDQPKPEILTLSLALEKYIETCRTLSHGENAEYSVATVAGYASVARSIRACPAFAAMIDVDINQITVSDIQSALDEITRNKTVSAKTLRNWYGLLKPTLDKYGPDLRLDRIKIAKNKRKKSMVIRESSIPAILSQARRIDPDFFLYVLFTAVLGTRPSESYALRWGDLSAEKMVSIVGGVPSYYGEINISKACVRDEFNKYHEKGTKTEAGTRSLTRHWSFFETLYSVKPRGRDEDRIFSMSPNSTPYRWRQLRQSVDLPEGMVMYDLRHYHATAMEACGASDNYIAQDMGHSDIATTKKHYMEIIEEKQQEINTAMFGKTELLLSSLK